jgi:hypothetical protein
MVVPWRRRGDPPQPHAGQPFYQAKVAGDHRRDESGCILHKARIGLRNFPGFQCPDEWRAREQPEKKGTDLLNG